MFKKDTKLGLVGSSPVPAPNKTTHVFSPICPNKQSHDNCVNTECLGEFDQKKKSV